jgi:hypothetical protein
MKAYELVENKAKWDPARREPYSVVYKGKIYRARTADLLVKKLERAVK